MACSKILLLAVVLGVLAMALGFPAEGPLKRVPKGAAPPPPSGAAKDLQGAESYGYGWGWGGYGGWGWGGWGWGGWGYPYWGGYYGGWGYPYWGGYYGGYYPYSWWW